VIRFVLLATAWLAAAAAAAESFTVAPELWDRPRSGKRVLEQPAVRQAVNAWLTQPGANLVVHHRPGQESLITAEELRNWLAALAVDPSRVELRGDLKPGEPLRIEVVRD
jgi:hypothetical protein